MGKRRYKRHKAMREDYAAIQSAGKKRSLWGSVGSTLLSGLAMVATGGAAAPVVAGLMAGGGSLVGGHLGNWLAGKTKLGGSGKLGGTRWYKSIGKELGSTLKEGITAGAMKTGWKTALTAGAMSGGKSLLSKFAGKGGTAGATATKDTNALARLFKGGDKGGQTGFKSLIDYEGSAMSGFFDKMASARTGRELIKEGEASLGTGIETRGGSTGLNYPTGGAQGPPTLAARSARPAGRGYMAPGEITSKIKSANIDQMLQKRGPLGNIPSIEDVRGSVSGPGFQKGILPGHSKIQYDVAQAKSAEISEGLKNYQFSPDRKTVYEPTSYGGGIDETRMSVEDWKSAIPSDAGTINPAEIRRPTDLLDYSLEKTDVPKMGSLFTKQGLKSGLEDFFAPGSVYEPMDILSYPSDYAQGPPEMLGREIVKHAGPTIRQNRYKNLFGR